MGRRGVYKFDVAGCNHSSPGSALLEYGRYLQTPIKPVVAQLKVTNQKIASCSNIIRNSGSCGSCPPAQRHSVLARHTSPIRGGGAVPDGAAHAFHGGGDESLLPA